MIDLHWHKTASSEPYIAMCHEKKKNPETDCFWTRMLIKRGEPEKFESFLYKVKSWLIHDPNTIITLHCESYLGDRQQTDDQNNVSHLSGQKELQSLLKKVGLLEYVYNIPNLGNTSATISQWPTLGEMRKSNQRLVIFSDRETDGVIYTKSYRETQYELMTDYKCEMRDDKRDVHKKQPLLVLNHFYGISLLATEERNSYEDIMFRVNKCREFEEQAMLPNFIAVDFVDKGNNGGPIRVVTELNKKAPSDFHTGIQKKFLQMMTNMMNYKIL